MNIHKNNRGVSAVEFALVLPLLLMVLFMVIEFSILFYDKAVITNASREGARAGIVKGGPTKPVAQIVNDYCAANLISFAATAPAPATTITGACAATNDMLQVSVQYTYSFLVLPNFFNTLTPGISLTGVTVMRCE